MNPDTSSEKEAESISLHSENEEEAEGSSSKKRDGSVEQSSSDSENNVPLSKFKCEKQNATVGDCLLVSFEVSKTVKYYVGMIVIDDTDGDIRTPYHVKFLRQSHKVAGQFYYPNVEDTS